MFYVDNKQRSIIFLIGLLLRLGTYINELSIYVQKILHVHRRYFLVRCFSQISFSVKISAGTIISVIWSIACL